MVIDAARCQAGRTAWKPCYAPLTPLSAPALVHTAKHMTETSQLSFTDAHDGTLFPPLGLEYVGHTWQPTGLWRRMLFYRSIPPGPHVSEG